MYDGGELSSVVLDCAEKEKRDERQGGFGESEGR